jgi:agarase
MYLRRFDLVRIAVSAVDIVQDSLSVQNGTSRMLIARVSPSDATDRSITWASDNEAVATVSPTGQVTAKSLGKATITLNSDDGGFADSIVVVVQQAPVRFDRIRVEAKSFAKTGSTSGNKPGGYDGVNATQSGINWVNSGDWVEYQADFPSDGVYALTYSISTPVDGAKIQFQLDGNVRSDDVVPNNGHWDDYRSIVAGSVIKIKKGRHVIRLVASGTNQWQWNLEHFELTKIREISAGP